jgi:hypothetical protein
MFFWNRPSIPFHTHDTISCCCCCCRCSWLDATFKPHTVVYLIMMTTTPCHPTNNNTHTNTALSCSAVKFVVYLNFIQYLIIALYYIAQIAPSANFQFLANMLHSISTRFPFSMLNFVGLKITVVFNFEMRSRLLNLFRQLRLRYESKI